MPRSIATLFFVVLLASTCVVAETYADELPYLRGERWITKLTFDTLDEHLRGRPSDSPALLFVGASWCPHCRNFKPTFNIIADELYHRTEGPKVQCYFYEAIEDKDPISKKYKLNGYPTLVLFEGMKLSKYDSAKEKEPIMKWLEDHPEVLKETYPDYMPGPIDEFFDTIGELIKTMRANFNKDPSSMIYSVGAVGIVLAGFMFAFLYALISSCCGSKDEDAGEVPTKKPKED